MNMDPDGAFGVPIKPGELIQAGEVKQQVAKVIKNSAAIDHQVFVDRSIAVIGNITETRGGLKDVALSPQIIEARDVFARLCKGPVYVTHPPVRRPALLAVGKN